MKCYNCGIERLENEKLYEALSCRSPGCSGQISHCADNYCTKSSYCPTHQQEFPRKIAGLERKITNLEQAAQSRGSLASPSQELQALRTENQRLTTSLSLQATEQADLQAQIRALHSQLSERENNQPSQAKITKLETKLELVKHKLTQWTQLLTKHD